MRARNLFIVMAIVSVISVNITCSRKNPVQPVVKITTRLAVNSDPKGAIVYLDGVFWAITSTGERDVEPGEHHLSVEKSGFLPEERTDTLTVGETKVLNIILKTSPYPDTRLAVNSDPKGARVYLDGPFFALTPTGERFVEPGNHVVQLELPGYIAVDTTVDVPEGKTRSLFVKLEESPHKDTYLEVKSEPYGATVYLDDVFLALTPTGNRIVEPGEHSLRLELSGYEKEEKTIIVTEGKTTSLNFPLTPLPYMKSFLSVESDPAGATVLLDGVFLALTPTRKCEVKSGEHTVRLELSGYIPEDSTVFVPPGETEKLLIPMTENSYGETRLAVNSDPSGAAVYLDDAFLALTPTGERIVEPGDHVVQLEKTGYDTIVDFIHVNEGETERKFYELREIPDQETRIVVYSHPSGAAVYLDNAFLALTPTGEREADPGVHSLRLYLPGYNVPDSTIDLPLGETQVFNFYLNPLEQIPWADSSFHVFVDTEILVDSVITLNPSGTVDRARVKYSSPPSPQNGEAAALMWYCDRTDLWYQVRFDDTQEIGESLIWIGFAELPLDRNEKFYWVFSGQFGETMNSLHCYGVGGYEEGGESSPMTRRFSGGIRGKVSKSRMMPQLLRRVLWK